MLNRPCEPIEPPDKHGLELPGPSGAHQAVERRPPLPHSGEATINKLLHDLPATIRRVRAQREQLDLGVLCICADASVEGCLHFRSGKTSSNERPPSPSCRSYQRSLAFPRLVRKKRRGSIGSPCSGRWRNPRGRG